MKRFSAIVLILVLALVLFAACSQNGAQDNGGNSGNQQQENPGEEEAYDFSKTISVVSREDGSGTRSAFIELFAIEEKGDDGSKKDLTYKEAIIADKTDIMMSNIAGNPYAIGYISLGSLNSSVKALDIDGVNALPENVKNGSYKIQRPFNIATKGEAAGLTKDFIDFILSREGQKVVTDNNYVAVDENAPGYDGAAQTGKITVAGSSSVTPIMEKLKEAYIVFNPEVIIEVQMTDSTAGMTSAVNGVCDIGMSSRELKDSEKAELTPVTIALDGVAVIVNNENPLNGLSAAQIKSVFTGEYTAWSNLR
jgi:phosphate transport system substrate-binding protein